MSKIRNIQGGGQIFQCPGCNHMHQLNTRPDGPRWTYNNDPDKPTFSPSILYWYDKPDNTKFVCHSFVTDGRIQFLGDCTHELANQTVDIPEWPYNTGEFGGIID
jgi:hypothetical protein